MVRGSLWNCIIFFMNGGDIAKKLLRFLRNKENMIMKIQYICVWSNSTYSIITLFVIELVFCIFYFSDLSFGVIMCVLMGMFFLIKSIIEYKPSALDFTIEKVNMKTLKEISAFYSTVASYIFDLYYSMFISEKMANISSLIKNCVFLSIMYFTFRFVGDFWILWLIFHLLFIIPGIILNPKVSSWYKDDGNYESIFKTLPIEDFKQTIDDKQ